MWLVLPLCNWQFPLADKISIECKQILLGRIGGFCYDFYLNLSTLPSDLLTVFISFSRYSEYAKGSYFYVCTFHVLAQLPLFLDTLSNILFFMCSNILFILCRNFNLPFIELKFSRSSSSSLLYYSLVLSSCRVCGPLLRFPSQRPSQSEQWHPSSGVCQHSSYFLVAWLKVDFLVDRSVM